MARSPIRIYAVLLSVVLVLTGLQVSSMAWSESAHHIIAVLAFDLLTESEQSDLLRILEAHPRYAEDFTPPEKIRNIERWRIGTAGYWPDIARRQPRYNRSTWHYQLASTLTIGDETAVNVPETPGPCPSSATLDTQELQLNQAVVLCRHIMADVEEPLGDRAIALTWVAHLVADAHQPCHAGSLYVADVSPDGDRGANSIRVVQGNNLHALWDGLLGKRYDEGDVSRRVEEVTGSGKIMKNGRQALRRNESLDPHTWLQRLTPWARCRTARPLSDPRGTQSTQP